VYLRPHSCLRFVGKTTQVTPANVHLHDQSAFRRLAIDDQWLVVRLELRYIRERNEAVSSRTYRQTLDGFKIATLLRVKPDAQSKSATAFEHGPDRAPTDSLDRIEHVVGVGPSLGERVSVETGTQYRQSLHPIHLDIGGPINTPYYASDLRSDLA
jgi:hypothetical protein